MLRGIHPLLGPDLLHALRSMGHGDELVIADANFPAGFLGPRLVRLEGVEATAAVEAILTHMPLDSYAPAAAYRMEVVGDPQAVPEICRLFQDQITRLAGQFTVEPLERFAFYERARAAAVVVATGERRLYGNLILKMGVLPPP
jgi:L-fucose mutarotase